MPQMGTPGSAPHHGVPEPQIPTDHEHGVRLRAPDHGWHLRGHPLLRLMAIFWTTISYLAISATIGKWPPQPVRKGRDLASTLPCPKPPTTAGIRGWGLTL